MCCRGCGATSRTPTSPIATAMAKPSVTAVRLAAHPLMPAVVRPPGRMGGLVRVTVAEAVPDRLDENPQVEGEAPALDVVEVVLDPPLDRGVPPPAVDLGPAGDARLHLVAKHVARHAAPEFFDEARPLGSRANQTHLAAQHVEELGQLVEA